MKLMTKALAAKIPPLYATENIPMADKIVHVHYFSGPYDAYLVEYDEATHEGFGYTVIAGHDSGEWGYINLDYLASVKVPPFGLGIERDLYWDPTPVCKIPKITGG